jgi:hypothetical protein
MIVNIVPLTENLELVTTAPVVESDDDRILIPINYRLLEPTENVAIDFTVKIDGAEKEIASAAISNGNLNGERIGIIALTLAAPLVPTDANKVVTVSYNGANILSLDERPLQAFTDAAVTVYVPTPITQTGTIMETSDDKIQIGFDQAIDPASLVSAADAKAGFIIGLNGGAGTIATIAVNSSDPTKLDITLVEGQYQDDVITIAYTGPGEIASVGGGVISDFTAKTVTPYILNLLTDSGFEGTFGDYWTEGASGAGATIEFSDDVAASGTKSAKMTALKPRLESGATMNYVTGKTYVVSYKRYILGSTVTLDAAFHAQNHGDKIWFDTAIGGSAKTPRWYGENFPLGTAPALDTWIDVQAEYTAGADSSNVKLRLQPVPTSGTDYTVYFDDFIVYEKDVRP